MAWNYRYNSAVGFPIFALQSVCCKYRAFLRMTQPVLFAYSRSEYNKFILACCGKCCCEKYSVADRFYADGRFLCGVSGGVVRFRTASVTPDVILG